MVRLAIFSEVRAGRRRASTFAMRRSTPLADSRPQYLPRSISSARRLAAALVAVALIVVARPAAAQHALSTLPLSDPAYAQLEGLARRGCLAARVSPFRPYYVADVVDAVRAARADARCAPLVVEVLRVRFVRDSAPVAAPVRAPADTVAMSELEAVARQTAQHANDDVRHSYIGGAATAQLTGLGRGEFRPYFAAVRPNSAGTPPGVFTVRARAVFDGGSRFVALSEGYLQSSRRNDPLVRGKDFAGQNATLDFGEAYANAKLGSFVVSLGRSREVWLGEGSESLVLSGNVPPLDRVLVSGRWKRVEGRAFFAALNDVTLTAGLDSLTASSGDRLFHRTLVGHVIAAKPTRATEVTLGETMLFSRRSRGEGLSYANVLIPFIVSQNDTGLTALAPRDNLVLFGSARTLLGPALLEGELVADDFQYGRQDRQIIPDQLAWRIAASAPLSFVTARPASISASYRHVNTYTYERPFYTEGYHSYDRPLGSELGPDADIALAGGELWLRGDVLLAANVGRWRQGAIHIDQRPGRSVNNGFTSTFPSTSIDRPAIQSATLVDASLRLLRATLPVTMRFEAARITNAANQPHAAELYIRAQLLATYAFRYP
jgi:Capsule assembly protein Wzi